MESKYIVTREGQVIGPRGVLKGQIDKGGYCRVQLMLNGIRYWRSVHRLVALKYLPNPDNLPQVNHKDGNKMNNHVDNLEWCTCSGNIQHSYNEGLRGVGENHHTAKLSDDDAEYIRNHYVKMSREFGSVALGKRFGISSRAVIGLVKNEYRVKHFGGDE